MAVEAGGKTVSEPAHDLVTQHLIDPQTCLRCGGCEATCPEGAVKFDSVTFAYAIDPDLCEGTHECMSVCSSNAINSWRDVPAGKTYSLQEQFAWEELPTQLVLGGQTDRMRDKADAVLEGTLAPATASHPVTFRYTHDNPVIALISSNECVTFGDSEIHHVVLDFSGTDFEWLEGQNIGVLPEGQDSNGRDHVMRAYSIASARDGEKQGDRTMALTIKRVIDEWEGKPHLGICSNQVCDLPPGKELRVVGPIGDKFLLPEDREARIMMIATGTGIAPMRAFVQRQERSDPGYSRPMRLLYGGRTQAEMAYLDELVSTPGSLLELHLALSRSADTPKQYVQDILLASADSVADFLKNDNSYLFICGLIAMEQGVMQALAKVAADHGLDWDSLHHRLLGEGRLQIEVY